MLPGGVRSLDPELDRFRLQLFRDPRHPHEWVDKQVRNTQKVDLPVRPDLMPENLLQLLLKPHRHVDHEKQTGGKEIDEPEPETRTVGMVE